MRNCRLRVGMRYERQGRRYVILETLGGGEIKVREEATDNCFPQQVNELAGDLYAGKIELLGEDGERDELRNRLAKSQANDLTMFDDNDPLKVEMLRRLKYVNEALRNEVGRTRAALMLLILKTAESEQDPKPPSWITLKRWLRIYVTSGGDARSLVPATKARGNRGAKAAGRLLSKYTVEDREKAKLVAGLVRQAINTKYLTPQQLSVRAVHDEVANLIEIENRYLDAAERLPTPHVSAIHKAIRKLDPYRVACARKGKRYADEKFRVNKQGPRPTRALERVECDHTRIDMLVVDQQTRLPMGRPWLTTIIDVYTKMILGFYLGFHHPCAMSVLNCLRHAVRPKSYVKDDYPSVEHGWPVYGTPECLVVDNGREFHGEHLADACLQLGICVQYSPPRKAWYRPSIERWFGTQNKKLLHELPGTTFSNVLEKGEYDPKKHAVISLAALREMIHIWVVDIYHQSLHRGIDDIPHRRWNESVAEWPPNLPLKLADLDVLAGLVERRAVRSSGIELFTLNYNCAELAAVRRALKPGEKTTVKYDPNDISLIYVWDKVGRRFVPVPALDQDYSKGLSLWQHETVRKFARKLIGDQVDAEALNRARRRLQRITADEILFTRRSSQAGKGQSGGDSRSTATSLRQGTRSVENVVSAGDGILRLLPEQVNVGVSDVRVGGADELPECVISPADSRQETDPDWPTKPGADWGVNYKLPRQGGKV